MVYSGTENLFYILAEYHFFFQQLVGQFTRDPQPRDPEHVLVCEDTDVYTSGLPVARYNARLHGGSLTLAPGANGLLARVRLPATRD